MGVWNVKADGSNVGLGNTGYVVAAHGGAVKILGTVPDVNT